MSRLLQCLKAVVLASAGLALLASPALLAQNPEKPIVSIREWTVLGAFPNAEDNSAKSECTRAGFNADYLLPLGGEAKAELSKDAVVKFKDASGAEQEAKAVEAKTNKLGILDFKPFFKDSDLKVAYAYAVFKLDKAQDVYFFFGSDDSAKVWLNGQLVHEKAVRNRATNVGDDTFKVSAKEGENRILVKVENAIGGWDFALKGMDKAAHDAISLRSGIQNCEIFPRHGGNYVFRGDKFPRLDWSLEDDVADSLGVRSFSARFFDSQLNEVTRADKPGRYIAYVELQLPDGSKFRRSLTLCKQPEGLRFRRSLTLFKQADGFRYNNLGMKASLPLPPKGSGITQAEWNSHKDALNIFGEGVFANGLAGSGDGAAFLAYALEMKTTDTPASTLDNPWIANIEANLALKRKILGVADSSLKPLQPPAKASPAATELKPGTAAEASMKDDAPAKLKEVCKEWAHDSELPFVALVARNGVVFFHQAFGNAERDEKFEAASITKSTTGMLFAQFLDQGIMNPDDPLGKYLPDFPSSGDKIITIRNCLTHTAGLSGHFEWGGVHNPWLDNAIANNLAKLQPGKAYLYNGVDFDLVGKAMEMASGKSALRLFQENLFLPLGMKNVYQWDMASVTMLSAEDFAKLAQLMLNQGSYGDKKFFSPETFEKVSPKDLSTFYPGVKESYGFGLTYLKIKDPDAGKNGVPEDKLVLGKRVIGHGAASSSFCRADLDHNLVIAVARNSAGPNYDKHLARFLKTIEEGLK